MTNLWLDLGNTRLKYWLIQDGQVLLSDAKEHLKAPNELLLGLIGTFEAYNPSFVGISSVLGNKINKQIKKTLTKFGIAFEFAVVDDNHRYLSSHYNPNQLGVDRWLQMLGANNGNPLCIIGCGTALTIDIISDNVHLGGYILPNTYMQRHALYAGTQQIAVKEGKFDNITLGTNTFDAVNHGVLFGITAAVNHISAEFEQYQLILTGGGAQMIAPFLHKPFIIMPDLLLLGLCLWNMSVIC